MLRISNYLILGNGYKLLSVISSKEGCNIYYYSKISDLMYCCTHKIINNLNSHGYVMIVKKGRDNNVFLTDKGKKINYLSKKIMEEL